MAVETRAYQRATHNQLEKCLRWTMSTLQLRDWEVDFWTMWETKDANTLGNCHIFNSYTLKAKIEIDLAGHKKENENPYCTVIHEVLHLLTCGVCQIDAEQSEPISYRLEGILYHVYCEEHRIKEADVKAINTL